MPGFYGADIAQLRALAKTMSRQAFREVQSVTLPGAGLLTVTSIQPAEGSTAATATLTYDGDPVTD
ncbi:hypothetical protein [Paenarthrobacter nitroguajacolicus]|uniref:hypothetical protein n=1 Tax=Paenarthrobacter nitroguajacolicus TaxID=211146 RepID=UPI004054622F